MKGESVAGSVSIGQVGIVVLTLMILGSVVFTLLPTTGGHPPRGARRIVCLNNVKQITVLARIYADRNGNRFPEARRACDALAKIRELDPDVSAETFVCPNSDVEVEKDTPLTPDTSTYAWTEDPRRGKARRPLVSDDSLHYHRDGLNVGFTTGDVRWVPLAELPAGETLPEGLINNFGSRPSR